ncbi:MAG: YitT family protein [Clostridium sp.]|nr:YitT family protein [Clostridium sp.]
MAKKKITEYFFITMGIILVAISVEYFFIPNNLAAGGVTGLAIVINKFIPNLNVSLITFIINMILFIVAFILIGGSFGEKTLFATIGLSIIMWIIEEFLSPYALTKDLIIATIFGTLISAIGMAIVFNNNASTGGTDILAKILNKFSHIDIGKALLIIDLFITLMAAITFGLDLGFYSMLSVIGLGITIDRIIDGFNTKKEILIMSSKVNEISNFILKELTRGCTYLKGVGAYTKKDINVIYTVLERKEFIKLKLFIKEIDPNAFISVREAYEVMGEGFMKIE